MKLLKRDTEIYFNIVVSPYAYSFHKLRRDHFLGLKGAFVKKICLCQELIVFLAELFYRLVEFRMCLLCCFHIRLCRFGSSFGVGHQRIEKINTQPAFSLNDFEGLCFVGLKAVYFLRGFNRVAVADFTRKHI